MLTTIALTAPILLASAAFDSIRIGDMDGFGFGTGTEPCGSEACWPFGSPWYWVQDDGGLCSGFMLINAAGLPVNVDGADTLTEGDSLPDLDCAGSYQYSSDEFDNREPAEITGGSYGTYVEVSGATDLGSDGSGWTDVCVAGFSLAWADCVLEPTTGPDICDAGHPGFIFDFSAPDADPAAPVYFNVVLADFDIASDSDTITITTGSGDVITRMLTTESSNTGAATDGRIQRATAAIDFEMVFPGWSSGSTDGYVEISFDLPLDPFVAYDYAELSITPLVTTDGCCCFPGLDGVWQDFGKSMSGRTALSAIAFRRRILRILPMWRR